ncbi:MAG TPA: hypothetical protein DGH68_10670 [Bacteroidetes bacterium]|nr:hypothetical protein [Bacteroidota bacterium]
MRTGFRFIALQAFALFCLSFCSFRAVGQSPVVLSHIVASVNQLSIGDINFRNSTTPKWLFTINIQVVGGGSLEVEMEVFVNFTLPGYESPPEALRIATEPFTVNGMRSVSNLDFDRTIPLKPGSQGYSLDPEARRRLEEVALPTGQIPAGTYSFRVVVTPVGGTLHEPGETGFELGLSNPTIVQLLSPADGDQFASRFPLFQWLYDGPSSRISVFEKFPGQASLEEAASGVPHYSATSGTNSLQYPSSDTRILEPGKTYVWFVEGLIGSAGGTTVVRKSDLRSFAVASVGAQSLSSILDELARILPQYQGLFDDLKAQGFTNSATLRLNGSVITLSDLQRVLNTFRRNPDAVTSVELE